MYELLLKNINNIENNSIQWTYDNNNDIYIKHCQYYYNQEKHEKHEKQEKHEKHEKHEKQEKHEKHEKHEKQEKHEKHEKQEKQEKQEKHEKQNPIEFILNKCNMINTDITKNIIKDKFKLFITEHKVTKIFGQKKTSEMLNGILNNKWNISLVILISFIFDTKFIYLKKEVLFNKNLENYPVITL